MDWDPSNQNDTVPQELYYIKLMKYDVDNPRDIIAASMYFNTMSSKAKFDTYIDRVMQAKALIKVYNEDLDNNRSKTCRALHEEQAAKRAEGGRVKTVQKRKGKVLHTEVVEWLGINAGLLCDGDGFSKSKIALGVLCRIASLVPDELLTWMPWDADVLQPREPRGQECGQSSAAATLLVAKRYLDEEHGQ